MIYKVNILDNVKQNFYFMCSEILVNLGNIKMGCYISTCNATGFIQPLRRWYPERSRIQGRYYFNNKRYGDDTVLIAATEGKLV